MALAMGEPEHPEPVLRVGTAMWANPDWVGTYMTDTRLSSYATWCNAVEGNTTFYADPAPATVERWARDAPEGFWFCFKLPRSITHDRRLRGSTEMVEQWLRLMSPLHQLMGPVQIQLPASYGPDDTPALLSFLDEAPEPPKGWAVELRHPAFAPGGRHERAINDALATRSVDRVLIDTRPLFAGPASTEAEQEAFAVKPRIGVRPVATGRHPIVRFIGQTDQSASARFAQPWVAKAAQWLDAGLEPVVFIHTPDNRHALPRCRAFYDSVTAACDRSLPTLPDPLLPSRQLDLDLAKPERTA